MKYFIIIGIVLGGFLSSCDSKNENSVEGAIAKDVSVLEFKKLINSNEGVLLDVRTPEEVAGAKINGSINININDSNFETELSKIDKKKAVYVYCKSGGRSGKAMDKMNSLGFTKVYNLDGGITAWISEGLETK